MMVSSDSPRGVDRRHARQSGQVLVTVALALTALMGVGVLTIDIGLLRVCRGQLQSAADAAARAGAIGLRTIGPDGAFDFASTVAASNQALADRMRPIALAPDDLLITGPGSVRVTLRRSPTAGSGLRTVFAPIFGYQRERAVTATAEVEIVELCSVDQPRPLVLPDLWADLDGDGLCDPDEPYSPEQTGYQPGSAEGTIFRLRTFEPRGEEPATAGSYLRVRLPPMDTDQGNPRPGVGNYRRFLSEGAPYEIRVGDQLELQTVPVHMTTYRVLTELIARDLGAYWDADEMVVVSGTQGVSPRVIRLALIDPHTIPEVPRPPNERRLPVKITRLAAAFIEDVDPDGTIILRLVPHSTTGNECLDAERSFVYRTRLIL
jgi:Flp pilus assembly protein TadG